MQCEHHQLWVLNYGVEERKKDSFLSCLHMIQKQCNRLQRKIRTEKYGHCYADTFYDLYEVDSEEKNEGIITE